LKQFAGQMRVPEAALGPRVQPTLLSALRAEHPLEHPCERRVQ